MPNKTYIVELTSEERKELKRLINTGKTSAHLKIESFGVDRHLLTSQEYLHSIYIYAL